MICVAPEPRLPARCEVRSQARTQTEERDETENIEEASCGRALRSRCRGPPASGIFWLCITFGIGFFIDSFLVRRGYLLDARIDVVALAAAIAKSGHSYWCM